MMPYRMPAPGPTAAEIKKAEAEKTRRAERTSDGSMWESVAKAILLFKAEARALHERRELPVDGEHY